MEIEKKLQRRLTELGNSLNHGSVKLTESFQYVSTVNDGNISFISASSKYDMLKKDGFKVESI